MGKVVVFTFDEWVDENNLKDQLIITPKINDYKHSVNKNVLTLTFDTGTFQPNTTYYFNLREGIKDITEGNKGDSISLVFSTGKQVDSLSLEGIAFYALENKREKNISVALYLPSDTFNIETATPLYLTKTNLESEFKFYHLKKGKYLLYAFKDDNNNGRYDANKEYIAYASQQIDLAQSIQRANLGLVKEDHEKPKIKNKESSKKRVTKITYKKPIKSLFNNAIYPYNMNICYIVKQDEVSIFTNSLSKDSVQLILDASDFSGNRSIDTIKIVSQYVDTSKCIIGTMPSRNSEIEPSDAIQIILSKPYTKFINTLELTTQGKTYKGKQIEQIAEITEIPYLGTIQLSPKKEWKDTIKLTVPPTSFVPISGYIKDTAKTKYPLKSLEKYGSIGGRVECSTSNIIVQLVAKDGKILKEVLNKKDFLFEYLTDGEYKIRVVEDINQNKMWDQGDYRIKRMPENIYHHPEPIKLKPNWEILDVKISF
jgi:uncharacterized protein (DUF2141 family)